jgi:hypothetical protein
LARRSSTGAEHSYHHPKVRGFSLDSTASIEKTLFYHLEEIKTIKFHKNGFLQVDELMPNQFLALKLLALSLPKR